MNHVCAVVLGAEPASRPQKGIIRKPNRVLLPGKFMDGGDRCRSQEGRQMCVCAVAVQKGSDGLMPQAAQGKGSHSAQGKATKGSWPCALGQ